LIAWIWGLAPTSIVREDVVILDAAARLGHHLGDGVAPGLVVGGLLVLRRCGGRPINLDQYRIYVPSRPFCPPKPFSLSFVSCGTVPDPDPGQSRKVAGLLDTGASVFCLK
jgi:hypothetical protein